MKIRIIQPEWRDIGIRCNFFWSDEIEETKKSDVKPKGRASLFFQCA